MRRLLNVTAGDHPVPAALDGYVRERVATTTAGGYLFPSPNGGVVRPHGTITAGHPAQRDRNRDRFWRGDESRPFLSHGLGLVQVE
ncbi:MAG: hypothetical protein ACOH17_10600 [Cellulomonas sp.]